MTYVIFKKENPILMVETLDSVYNPQLTNDVARAMKFTSSTSAMETIIQMPGSVDFWGTRPSKPK
jgi:hypothetical protein